MSKLTFPDVSDFQEGRVGSYSARATVDKFSDIQAVELRDVKQQITMRPIVALFFGILLLFQNLIVFTLVYLALKHGLMKDLQLIFAVLIAGSLVQSYKISQLIVNKLFEAIDYKDKHERFKN